MVKALNENKMVTKTIIIQFKIIMFEPTFMVIHLFDVAVDIFLDN